MQKLPEIFVQKIEIDKRFDALKKSFVVSINELRQVSKVRNQLRRQCQIALAIHKVEPDGAGSPVQMVA